MSKVTIRMKSLQMMNRTLILNVKVTDMGNLKVIDLGNDFLYLPTTFWKKTRGF